MNTQKETAKIASFEVFAKRAKAKIEERKKTRRKMMHIGDLDMDIEIRGLSDQELNECMEYSENEFANDKYTLYFASRTLQELAMYMKGEGQIERELEVVDMFSRADRKRLLHEILNLSGINDNTTVSEVEETKNS